MVTITDTAALCINTVSLSVFCTNNEQAVQADRHGGTVGKASDLCFIGHGFESCLGTTAHWP